MSRTLGNWGWSAILITALAVVGYIYEWPIAALAPVLVVILIIGLVMGATGTKERQLEQLSLRLKELSGHFNRRFMGDSALSIFVIIRTLLTSDNAKVWAWARECEVAQRIFNTWCSSFVTRLESDIRSRRFGVYLRTTLNELWLVNSHYYEFVEQFCEVAENVKLPRETIDLYNRFALEYNAFVQDFQDNIAELRRFTRTEIEPPSVKMAKELSVMEPPQAKEEREEKPSRGKGYIT
jgi:DNA-binding Lrp family transcriptional regulator